MGKLDDNPHQPLQFLTAAEANEDIPDQNLIPPFKNKETWWYPPDQDDKGTYDYIRIITCPCHEQCDGSPSWKKAACWSFHGHLSCHSYLMHHLTKSTKHSMSEDDAYCEILQSIASGKIKFEACPYTGASRQIYREDVRLPAENDKKRKTTSSSHDEGKRGRSHKDDQRSWLAEQETIERIIKETATQGVRHMAGGSGGAASSGYCTCINSLPAQTRIEVEDMRSSGYIIDA